MEFEQAGQSRAAYGAKLLKQLSKDLKQLHGKGFSSRNISDMRRFYVAYPIWQTVSAKLSWSHYTELLASRYQLHLPDVELLKQELKRLIASEGEPE